MSPVALGARLKTATNKCSNALFLFTSWTLCSRGCTVASRIPHILTGFHDTVLTEGSELLIVGFE
ncbi:hypothetical protein BgiBS90_018332, partial [Biomphalaria glabrata]